ncbi:MAG: MFS transporter [Propionibacteriaceae bacterium]|jgi:MFS family permease|nr:MFS transporter [Propionibacteriaceae bacterium]
MSEDKLNVKTTLLLSFGFFASSLAWSIYNAFVPLLLADLVASATLIGFIMVIDNIFGLIFQPLFGRWSDKTRTRFGRRMPYIMVGIPICALAFILIPHMNSLWSLMGVLIIFTFVMSTWRSPVVSLMPDITPGPLRSQANGIVNLMGGVGSLIAFGAGGLLLKVGGYPLPFLTAAIIMIGALAVLVIFIREPGVAYEPDAADEKVKVKLTAPERKSLILLLFAIFFWFVGYNAIETFFTLFAVNSLGVEAGNAAMMLAVFSLTFLAFAVPAGFIGAKFGRRRTIMVGLVGIIVLFIPLTMATSVPMTIACLAGGGIFWACVNINSLPMVVRLAGEEKIGTYVGYYYFFSFGAQIVAPPLFGVVADLAGSYSPLFIFASLAFAAALAALVFVRHGEEEPTTTSTTEILDSLDD